MLIERVLEALDVPQPDDRGGNPLRGSRLGRCARQGAYMLWPEQFPPAPLPARTKLVFRFGDMIHELIRQQFRRVIPGQWGMEEERFWFKVPLTPADCALVGTKIGRGELRARIIRGGEPERGMGLTLNLAEPCLYVPTHLDGVAEIHDQLATVEIKSMATGSFRKALRGVLDYGYRVQMAVGVDASGVDQTVYVACRKDTCHLLEVLYSKQADAVTVRFTKSSKMVEILKAAGIATTDETEWEAALLEHPFEPGLLDDARERVRKIIRATPQALPAREYGPDFTCAKCGGQGTKTCGQCKGTGKTRVKQNPCGPCGGVGIIACPKACENGRKQEAELPWQCSYCPAVEHCWQGLYRLEVDERPHYIVRRADFEAAQIRLDRPEPPAVEDEVEEVVPAAVLAAEEESPA